MYLLVTGGAGFIGSNFVKGYLTRHPLDTIVNLDKLTYAGNLENLADLAQNPRHVFVRGDVKDRKLVHDLFAQYPIQCVVNFAAESHVDRSFINPELFLETNVVGTQVLLHEAMRAWKKLPDDKFDREYRSGVKFLQVSTDEVYGSLDEGGMFTELTPLAPNSPYSASKASADMLIRAYFKTFGLPVNITRCSNNYGPYQFPEKLIPLIIRKCNKGEKIPVYGDGMQIRDWLYVEDHCLAIETVLSKGVSGEVYNIGGNNEKANLEIVRRIFKELNIPESNICYVKDRPGHDRRYAIDNSKIRKELGWSPQFRFEDGIKMTIDWYLNNKVWLENIESGKYEKFIDSMYSTDKKKQ